MGRSTARVTGLIGVLALAGGSGAKMAVLHASVTITGGLTVTGVFDAPLPVATCADVAAKGTMGEGSPPLFNVPEPPEAHGDPGSVGGGHTFSSDVSATYKGPGTYTGRQLNATQMRVDTPPGSQETHIFAHPDNIGTMVVKPDGSGSFQFSGWQDPGSVLISGQVTWTCAGRAPDLPRTLAHLIIGSGRAPTSRP